MEIADTRPNPEQILILAEMPAGRRPSTSLTPRQVEIIHCLVRGLCPKEIAAHFGLSPKTVEAHLADVRRRLAVHTSAQLVYEAMRRGYLAPPIDESREALAAALHSIDRLRADLERLSRALQQ